MTRTGQNMEQLRTGHHEVDGLRYEEQQHGLTEVAEDSHHREGHAREVAERVSYEYLRRIPARRGY